MSARTNPSGAVASVLDRLRNVKSSATGWTALCPAPAHKDRRNSLSVAMGDDGRALIKCFGGCEAEAVVRALRLEWSDLFLREMPYRRIEG